MCRFFLFLLLSFSLGLFSQRGKNGSVIISVANSIVNSYTPLTSNAIAGTKTITVQSSLSYSVGDLIFIIQMQGASVYAGKDSIYPDLTSSIPTNTTFGAITNYNNCGNNEYHQISSIPNATSIVLDCGLKYNYDYLSKVQVIKVPRYLDLTLNGTGSITCPTWNGSVGGIAIIETKNNCILNSTPSFSLTGKGFRGGGFENATNFVGNNGRSRLMGRVGIGKIEDATYILDVLGASRMPGNARINGNTGISIDPVYRLDVFSNTSAST